MKKLLLLLTCLPLIGFSQDGPFYFLDNNIQREFYLHIPANLPANSPIVFVLHEWGGSASGIMYYSDFNTLSDQNNFAVCYPKALI
jgi:poly(3-hydroxybutyrate) depolymerase